MKQHQRSERKSQKQLQQQFNDSFVKISQELQESYKNAPVVEKKTIKEHIGDLNQTSEEDN
ncbi:hypothetical protein HPNQ4099_0545 [Helicobacter pylori NQ4099]|uniref:Uncharacterized protein n=2 Tax=Helicobacter pylori TaxID=210 RepID=J0IXL6_HELPX|nr:hypothetical protein HPNQ4099_0545 [Helicobacter pylori NQ4099]EJB34181.1 hypothetical protein HPNQ4076_0426 [Helicobacter pylori NQ4076]OOC34450.1 hypothetical protein BZK24_03465 [Helicobacter pylori]QTP05974.1 hypothetical protein J4T92_01675 [Helicobacter pylori]WQU39500.1 hypothetical protein KVE42_01680 [Helicobacter pylori]